MTLLQQATALAYSAKSEQQQKLIEEQTVRGKMIAVLFSETFGFDAEYTSYGEDVFYGKSRSPYGGTQWNRLVAYRYRIVADGTSFGLLWKYDSKYPELEVVYLPCQNCGQTFPYRLPHISFQSSEKGYAKNRLLTTVGNAALSGAVCSTCEAQPCRECGHPL